MVSGVRKTKTTKISSSFVGGWGWRRRMQEENGSIGKRGKIESKKSDDRNKSKYINQISRLS